MKYRWRSRSMFFRFQWSLVTLFSLLFLYASTTVAQDALTYRSALFDTLDLIQQGQVLIGEDDSTTIELIRQAVANMSDEELLNYLAPQVSIAEIESLLSEANELLGEAQAQQRVQNAGVNSADFGPIAPAPSSVIEIPEVTVEPGFCANTTGAEYLAALATERAIKLIFAAIKFECQQTLFGENGALACLAPALLEIAAETTRELAQFCLSEQRAGKGEVALEVERNIGAHLNAFIDETTTSSRASQVSMDQLQSDVTSTLSDLDLVQNNLDTNFVTVNNDLNTILNDLAQLDDDINELIALSDDIQFRVTVNEAEAEDVEERTSDLEESGNEIRIDTQNIIASSSALQNSTSLLLSRLNQDFTQLQRDRIAAAMAQDGVIVADYSLPAAEGGQLENAREVVARALLALENINMGKTGTARVLLAQGDIQYNNQNYLSAYGLYAQAYRALISIGTRR